MKTITLSADADEKLIEAERERARQEGTTLNAAFGAWLLEYASPMQRLAEFDAAVGSVCGKLTVGRKLSRDEMNAR